MLTLVTGAGGFVGRAVVTELMATARASDRVRLVDRTVPDDLRRGVEVLEGDVCDPELMGQALEEVDRVIHLAALPGGASEADYQASRRVNLEASLALADHLAGRSGPARLVYASSIAVFGAPLPAHGVTDDTAPHPAMTYGAHKLMVETALSNLTRLGRLEAVSLRLPGVVARPTGSSGLKSAFMSEVFHALAAGRPFVMPVGPEATFWALSARAAARALVHALEMPTAPASAVTLPALRFTAESLVAAVAAQTGVGPELVSYDPDPILQAQFGALPPLSAERGLALGFVHDGALEALVATTLHSLSET